MAEISASARPQPLGCQVLAVGFPSRTHDSVYSLITRVAGSRLPAHVRFSEHVPEAGLDQYALVLLHLDRYEERARLVSDLGLRWRTKLVVETDASVSAQLLVDIHRQPVEIPVLAIGERSHERQTREAVAKVLFSAPVIECLGPVLERICSEGQRELLNEVLEHPEATSRAGLARAVHRSGRTLSRAFSSAGLQPPRAVLRVMRVSRGITLMVRFGVGIKKASQVAGYAEPSCFRKATRGTFRMTAVELLPLWTDPVKLAPHFQRIILR